MIIHVIDHYMYLTIVSFFFFNDTATTEIYTLSLHDALPISRELHDIVAHTLGVIVVQAGAERLHLQDDSPIRDAFASIESSGREALEEMGRLLGMRSEEHTSELQSLTNLVCRLLLEKKQKETREARRPRTVWVVTPMSLQSCVAVGRLLRYYLTRKPSDCADATHRALTQPTALCRLQ